MLSNTVSDIRAAPLPGYAVALHEGNNLVIVLETESVAGVTALLNKLTERKRRKLFLMCHPRCV